MRRSAESRPAALEFLLIALCALLAPSVMTAQSGENPQIGPVQIVI